MRTSEDNVEGEEVLTKAALNALAIVHVTGREPKGLHVATSLAVWRLTDSGTEVGSRVVKPEAVAKYDLNNHFLVRYAAALTAAGFFPERRRRPLTRYIAFVGFSKAGKVVSVTVSLKYRELWGDITLKRPTPEQVTEAARALDVAADPAERVEAVKQAILNFLMRPSRAKCRLLRSYDDVRQMLKLPDDHNFVWDILKAMEKDKKVSIYAFGSGVLDIGLNRDFEATLPPIT